MVTFANVRQGIRVLVTRRAPESLRTPFHEALAWTCIVCSALVVVLAVAVWSAVSPVLPGLSPVGVITGSNMPRRMRNPGAEPMGWLYSHLGSMIGGGIAFHTAFAVLGAQLFFSYKLAGPLIMLPWMLPTIIGLPAIAVWTRRYRRRFSRG